jgi:hypothetical protein
VVCGRTWASTSHCAPLASCQCIALQAIALNAIALQRAACAEGARLALN